MCICVYQMYITIVTVMISIYPMWTSVFDRNYLFIKCQYCSKSVIGWLVLEERWEMESMVIGQI